ncbi:MAG: PQQ-binding-like beta-propeller repeat protein, partial [Acidobacteriaceae bacterium]|nr:PQQ-binding-like beta-propeller repeat protein [Acidobacteriaceae bacterium]
MSMRTALISSLVLCAAAYCQESNPSLLLHPTKDSWPTYNGDYSGRRYSTLDRINDSNVNQMSLAWVFRATEGNAPAQGGPFGGITIKGTPILLNGVLYFTAPDHVWAADARNGKLLWQFTWKSKGGIHIGNRGVGIYGNWLYFETPDCNLVSLNLKDGKERWHKSICDLDQQYYASSAPVIVKNHVLAGVSGDDLDIPGYLDARDPETGDLQWRFVTAPKKGEPGSETWPNVEAMEH